MYYKYNGYNIYYEKYGNSKKTIIILPGWGYTRPTFNNIIDKFKNKYTIYIFDYPGFGNSKIINENLTIYDYSKIIYNFIKDNKITNITIIAHSFGGRISSILISKEKLKVNKLILIDVAGIKRINIKLLIKKYIYKLLKLLSCLLPLEKKYLVRKKLFQLFSSNDYYSLPPNMYITFKNIIKEDLTKYYKKINIKTLIIWGEKDIDTPLKDAKKLNKIIKNSKLITYKNENHFSYLNKEIIKDINNFLNN